MVEHMFRVYLLAGSEASCCCNHLKVTACPAGLQPRALQPNATGSNVAVLT